MKLLTTTQQVNKHLRNGDPVYCERPGHPGRFPVAAARSGQHHLQIQIVGSPEYVSSLRVWAEEKSQVSKDNKADWAGTLFECLEENNEAPSSPAPEIRQLEVRYSIGQKGGQDTLAVYPKMAPDKYHALGVQAAWLICDNDERDAFLKGWNDALKSTLGVD